MVTLAFAQAGAVLVHKDPHHWTHGEEGLSADYHKLPDAFVGVFNTKYLYWLALALPRRRLLRRALGGRVVARPRLAGDPRERAARRGARAAAARVQADGVRPRVVPRDARRRRLPAAHQQLGPDGDRAELHAVAAAHGRDRRRRARAGAPCSAASSTRTSTTGSARSAARATVQDLPNVLRTPLEQPLFLLGDDLHPDRLLPARRDRRARGARPAGAACAGSRRRSARAARSAARPRRR